MTSDIQAWFDAYANELNAGDRQAILARYHPQGAWLVRRGQPVLLTHAQLADRYLGGAWQPPVHFAWQGLQLEAAGPGAVLAVGQFQWDRPCGQQELISYTGLLLLVDGGWCIRLEDENLAEILRAS
ncbi:MAG: hypothetical protein KGQ52_08030 [Alphaproteobacteria bacterium]|nr:hypothetical protein [Alphaproteobacteria bacterium]